MPWKEKTVEELRKEFCEEAKRTKNFSSLCREFDITRKTGYKWLERYKQNETLSNKSHRPETVANKTDVNVEEKILLVRKENPEWGGKTIRKYLENQGILGLPCVKTCDNILKRHGLVCKERSLAATAYKRFEKDRCNEMWQTDFKGQFTMEDGNKCFPLTILDDHSRFSIKIAPKLNTLGVMDSFREAFLDYGMPDSVLSDNGGTFKGFNGGYTTFERWLMEHDILPIHGRIKHPQTQGKIERFHKTMKNECLKHSKIADIHSANEVLQEWRNKYNYLRPHHAINLKCPGTVYVKSNQVYTDKIPSYEYGGEYHVLKVNSWGYVRFNGFQVYLSETMIHQFIEFRPNPHGETFYAYFRNFRIAEFDSFDGKLLNRSIFRM